MEKFATRQLEKRRALANSESPQQSPNRKKSHQTNASPKDESRMSAKDRSALNKLFGFPDPPTKVFALGKDSAAAVWWQFEPNDEITAWEVHRYRKGRVSSNVSLTGDDDHGNAWQYKGFAKFDSAQLEKTQVILPNLANEYDYRFTVKAINWKGPSDESEPSNPVMVEKPLPSGWYRFLDKVSGKYYYANLKTGQSSWTRPELDPYFLDESIVLNFHTREIKALKMLYEEEIAHFEHVSVTQFMDVLREIGERCTKRWINQLFRGYAGKDTQTDEEVVIRTWQHFMEVCHHIKNSRRKGGLGNLTKGGIENAALLISKVKVANVFQSRKAKLGDWVIEYSSLAERNFYLNTVTGESYWSMPAEVKFYIPPKLEDKLLHVFDYGDLEEFQQYFALLDVDNSGDLSSKEIRMLLRALNIEVSETRFNKLIRTVDLNGNGTIEFDEYCWMMYQLYRQDKNAFWGNITAGNTETSCNSTKPLFASFSLRMSSKASGKPCNDGGSEVDESTNHDGENGCVSKLKRSDSDLNSVASGDASIFNAKQWSGKLSLAHMKDTMQKMKQYSQNRTLRHGSGRVGMNSNLMRSGSYMIRGMQQGIQRSLSMRSISSFASNKQSMREDTGNIDRQVSVLSFDDSTIAGNNLSTKGAKKGFQFRYFCCVCGGNSDSTRNRSRKVSALNEALSQFDEEEALKPEFSPLKKNRSFRSSKKIGSSRVRDKSDNQSQDGNQRTNTAAVFASEEKGARLYAEEDEYADKGGVGLLRRSSSFGSVSSDDRSQSSSKRRGSVWGSMFSKGGSVPSEDDHGKFCMCGCRSY